MNKRSLFAGIPASLHLIERARSSSKFAENACDFVAITAKPRLNFRYAPDSVKSLTELAADR